MSEVAASAPAVVGALPSEASPWGLARRRLLRNRLALFMLAVFVAIVVLCLAAPLYAHHVAHTDPFRSNLNGTTIVDGKTVPVLAPAKGGLGIGTTPIGPTWDLHHYFLGADNQGRDVAARLLYGGRNSLLIGFFAGLITCLAGTLIGVVAGFFGGITDGVISRILEIVWAFPVYLFAICLSVILINQDIVLGPVRIGSGSIALPILIIGIVYIPYVGAAGSRRGAVAAPARVRRGRDRPWRVEDAAAPQGHPPERRDDGNRPLSPRHGDHDADRGGSLVPVDRRSAAGRELGDDHPGRKGSDPHPPGGRACARACDRAHGSRAQRARRRDP